MRKNCARRSDRSAIRSLKRCPGAQDCQAAGGDPDTGRHEAEKIIAEAQVEAKDLIGEHRIAQEAKQQAALIRQQAEQDVRALRAEADEYVFDMLSQLQEELSRSQRLSRMACASWRPTASGVSKDNSHAWFDSR